MKTGSAAPKSIIANVGLPPLNKIVCPEIIRTYPRIVSRILSPKMWRSLTPPRVQSSDAAMLYDGTYTIAPIISNWYKYVKQKKDPSEEGPTLDWESECQTLGILVEERIGVLTKIIQ